MKPNVRWRELVLPVGIITCLLVVLVPLPPFILDVLLACNITLAVVLLLSTVYTRSPLDLSTFPAILLVATLARLVLNVASTRLILTKAHTDGTVAAGQVIESFGQFVTGNDVIVGLVIFSILIVIQFVVITRGATRVSEVAARFALDGMSNRLAAVDAELKAGTIDVEEARTRRELTHLQSDFYGAMDGASKFVRGDAIAGVLITLVNIFGGLAIGLFQFGLSPAEAAGLYTKLTIGDGLVSQIPALLIALATGILVTRSASQSNLPSQILDQLFKRPQVLVITAVFLTLLVFTRLPAIPLLAVASSCLFIARQGQRNGEAPHGRINSQQRTPNRHNKHLTSHALSVEFGIGLLRLVDRNKGGDFLEKVDALREQLTKSMGLIFPKVHVRDNMQCERNEYRVLVHNNVIASGQLAPRHLLVIDPDKQLKSSNIQSEAAVHSLASAPARWVRTEFKQDIQQLGLGGIAASAVLTQHLEQIIRQHAAELLSRDATQYLMDDLSREHPTLVQEVTPSLLRIGQVQQVLQSLLREGISIRPLGMILEELGNAALDNQQIPSLVRRVRSRMARHITHAIRDNQQRVSAYLLNPDLESEIVASSSWEEQSVVSSISAHKMQSLFDQLAGVHKSSRLAEKEPVLLVHPLARPSVRGWADRFYPTIHIISHEELSTDTHVDVQTPVLGQSSLVSVTESVNHNRHVEQNRPEIMKPRVA